MRTRTPAWSSGHFAIPVTLLLAACVPARTTDAPAPKPGHEGAGVSASATFTAVDDQTAGAADIEALIQPYRSELQEQMNEVLGLASGSFSKATPEGTLGNLAADALLYAARRHAADTVHMALINRGGLRIPLAPGPILTRHAYELLPFENQIIVLSLSGERIEELAEQLAATGGEPIAGWTIEFGDGGPTRVRVNGRSMEPTNTYRLATVDYLADGGGDWSVLWEADDRDREELGLLIRDAFALYLRDQGTVHPTLEGRMRQVGADSRLEFFP